MKSIILIPAIFLILFSACKKKEEEIPKPVKTGKLEIIYHTNDPSENYKMRINYTINNSISESKDVNGPYYTYAGTANSGSELSGSLVQEGGYKIDVSIVFQGDTVFQKQQQGTYVAWRFNLPVVE